MVFSRHLVFGLLAAVFVGGAVELMLSPLAQAAAPDREELAEERVAESQAREEQRLQKRRNFLLGRLAEVPPCGPGSKDQRFVVSVDGASVCDNHTGLWWQQSPGSPGSTESACDNQSDCTWSEAVDYCTNLTLSGKTWRLATVEELQWDSLVDYSVFTQAVALNTPNGPFENVEAESYWSATEGAFDTRDAWIVAFIRGTVTPADKDRLSGPKVLAWCVSGGQDGASGLRPSPEAQGAATDRDELREQQLGKRKAREEQRHQRRQNFLLGRLAEVPPCGRFTRGQRFVVSEDGNTVCDNHTGLWWQQSPGSPGTTESACDNQSGCNWSEALDYCTNLTISGKTWRLATVEELQWDSLVDYSVSRQADALNTPNGPFQNVQSNVYWSVTERVDDTSWAWLVSFNFGFVSVAPKAFSNETQGLPWCVSGGQNGF